MTEVINCGYFVQPRKTKHSLEHPGIRQELREFKKNDDMWNLYLLGLWQFQKIDQDKQLSYFQIAGKALVFSAYTPIKATRYSWASIQSLA